MQLRNHVFEKKKESKLFSLAFHKSPLIRDNLTGSFNF